MPGSRFAAKCESARVIGYLIGGITAAKGPLGRCGQGGQMRLYGPFQIGEQGPEAIEIDLSRVGSYYGFGKDLFSVMGIGVKSILVVKCLAVKHCGLDAWLK